MQRPRTPAKLSESIHHQLNSYALAASAAGVGALALAQPAEAKIVYTPAHVVLHARTNTHYNLDVNHDRITDYVLFHTYSSLGKSSAVGIDNGKGNQVEGNLGTRYAYAYALKAGAKIGPSAHFTSMVGNMAFINEQGSFVGHWANNGNGLKNRYLGFEFAIKGETHYGWARASVSKFPFAVTLTGYAYETIPNKPIIAGKTHGAEDIDPGPGASLTNPIPDIPQPATLGALAMGAPGLSIWRREQSIVAKQ
jgi:hypothetical protein